MKQLILAGIGLLLTQALLAQNAISTYVIGVGANLTCSASSGKTLTTTDGFQMLPYYASSDSLGTATTCSPTFPTKPFGTTTQIYNASIDYNPADQYEYYNAVVDTTIGGATFYNTYQYRWPIGTCPSGTLTPFHEYALEDLLTTYDNSGNAWGIDFIPNGSSYIIALQEFQIVGSTVTAGALDTISTTGAPTISSSNGDFIFTPSGQMYLIANNEEIAIDYSAYSFSTQQIITGTYVGSVNVGSDYVVGLAYGSGNFIGAVATASAKPICSPIYDQIGILSDATTAIKYKGGFNSFDEGYMTSGVGAAKNLVSITATGTSGQYTVVYDVYVQNYGTYPDYDIQAYDNLGSINGPANVVSVSTAFVGTPPPASYGINLNAGYNGTTDSSLLQTGGTLYNYPVANDNFTIQVTVTLNNITAGEVYNNIAVAHSVGYGGVANMDTSTNGTNPNPDGSGNPGDAGEDIPTPFIVEITAQTAPCTTLPTVVFQETFGTAAGMTTTFPAGGTTQYTGVTTAPIGVNDYTVTSNANNAYPADFIHLTDHTTGTGDMMVVNADLAQDIVYEKEVTGLCTNLKYSFNAYVANIDSSGYVNFCNATIGYQYPQLNFEMIDASTGLVLANVNTDSITSNSWTSYGMRIALPATSSGNVDLVITNTGGGGCGNDFAIDDISFGLCDAEPTVTIDGTHAGCLDSTTTLLASIANATVFSGSVVYQWEDSTTGGVWTNIAGATDSTYVIDPTTAANAIWYRVNVATPGNSEKPCSYTSSGYDLVLLSNPSTPPTSATASGSESCTEVPITLAVVGGSLGNGAQWVWYTNSCGIEADSIGTGSSIVVEPIVTTSYFVQAVGTCNTTTCAAVAVNVSCVLPTDLVYFQGSYASKAVTLGWQVTDNENISEFYIERSLDGVTYTTYDSVAATSSQGLTAYTLQDFLSGVHSQNIQYRLILKLKTGDEMESEVVAITLPMFLAENIVVFPNPANTQLTIGVNSNTQQKMQYTVFNIVGQVVLAGNQALDRGANAVNVNGVANLPSGTYFVQIVTDDSVVQKKVIIER